MLNYIRHYFDPLVSQWRAPGSSETDEYFSEFCEYNNEFSPDQPSQHALGEPPDGVRRDHQGRLRRDLAQLAPDAAFCHLVRVVATPPRAGTSVPGCLALRA